MFAAGALYKAALHSDISVPGRVVVQGPKGDVNFAV